MKSKTKIEKQMRRKLNPEIVETILKAKKNEEWLEIASILASPRRRKIEINLDKINENSEEADTIIVPGKVLSKGEVTKRIRIAALSFSEEARKKLIEKKCEVVRITEEIKVNPKARGIKILK